MKNHLLDYGVVICKGKRNPANKKPYIDEKTGRRIAFLNPKKAMEVASHIEELKKL